MHRSLILALAGLTGCSIAPTVPLPPDEGVAVGDPIGTRRLLVADWPAAEREALVHAFDQGVPLVRLVGNELELAVGCSLANTTALDRRPLLTGTRVMFLRDQAEREVNLAYTPGGVEVPEGRPWSRITVTNAELLASTGWAVGDAELVGDCEGVSHAISALLVGNWRAEWLPVGGAGISDDAQICTNGDRCVWAVELAALDPFTPLDPCPPPLRFDGLFCAGADNRHMTIDLDCLLSGTACDDKASSSASAVDVHSRLVARDHLPVPTELPLKGLAAGVSLVAEQLRACGSASRARARVGVSGPTGVIHRVELLDPGDEELERCVRHVLLATRIWVSIRAHQQLDVELDLGSGSVLAR